MVHLPRNLDILISTHYMQGHEEHRTANDEVASAGHF
jgi:hypothetical protein